MSNLELADIDDPSTELEVGILIGVDFYHSFFTGKTIKGRSGPVASSSVLGWVLSGTFSTNESSEVSLSGLSFETHTMRIGSENVDSLRD